MEFRILGSLEVLDEVSPTTGSSPPRVRERPHGGPIAAAVVDTSIVALVVVDAENVRRSCWPNVTREQLVLRARAWAAREGHELLIVFDGDAPERARDLLGSKNADDAIVELMSGIDRPWWLVSSDRGLRRRVGDAPGRIVGGGSFIRSV